MRGKVPPPFSGGIIPGITPAYAGKRIELDAIVDFVQDHPRLCGEKYGYYTIEVSSLGSPPPMRGKTDRIHFVHHLSRITPAYAGKRPLTALENGRIWDHPRLCGEKLHSGSRFHNVHGSPPPMRGKGYLEPFYSIYHRITPAYAGKSLRCKTTLSAVKDHPRLCGEKSPVWRRLWKLSGSPPPMRGKAETGRALLYIDKDHPRLCGEKALH